MTDIRSIQAGKFNKLLADALKDSGDFPKPEWVDFVKTSSHVQRPTSDDDFWYKRTASILRQIYIRELVGVQRLRTRYGGRKDRGAKPARFVKSGGKIIRKILQQTDESGLTEKVTGKQPGRRLTAKGKAFLENLIK
ncbi:MAG: 40S ribosomal protein S19 [Nanoarchaeota archaeon]|nr:40S ribosomal protein S19 [Nanoarchaeota archaeon]